MYVAGNERRRIRAYPDKPGMSDRELPGHAVDDVERQRDDDVDHREQRKLAPRSVGNEPLERKLETDDNANERDRNEDPA